VAGNDEAAGLCGAKEVLQPPAAGGVHDKPVSVEKLVGRQHAADVAMADRAAVAGFADVHIAFGAVIHDPVLAAVRVDPDRGNIGFFQRKYRGRKRRHGQRNDGCHRRRVPDWFYKTVVHTAASSFQ
jgi:hypothetical protein